jgi:hypothetical protein
VWLWNVVSQHREPAGAGTNGRMPATRPSEH